MENNLVSLKDNFNKIIDIRNEIQEIFDILRVKIIKLQKMHTELIHACKTQLFIFGLDSFYFQNKIIDIEYEDMMRYFLAINNRMYCDYFKLYKIIVDYIHKNTKDKKMMEISKLNKFPPYKDLEPFKEYNINVLIELHEAIIYLLSSLNSHLHNKEYELVMHESKIIIGLNIDNFVTTFRYNISMIREKMMLFIKYMEFFHVLHTKYLQRFSNKIQLMYTHIHNDIHLEGNNTPTIDASNVAINGVETSREELTSEKMNEITRLVSNDLSYQKKSVNDILQECVSNSKYSEQDIAVYNVFSAIESKCISINDTSFNNITNTLSNTNKINETEEKPKVIIPKKRSGIKKKTET